MHLHGGGIVNPRPRTLPGLGLPRGLGLTLVLCLVTGALGIEWLHAVDPRSEASADAPLALVWPASGVATAAFFVYGRAVWPAVLLAYVVNWSGLAGLQFGYASLQGVAEVLSTGAVAWILKRLGFRPAFDDYRDAVALWLAATVGSVVGVALDAVIGIGYAAFSTDARLSSALAASGVFREGGRLVVTSGLLDFSLRWWANTISATVLIVPLLALGARTRVRPPRRSGLEALLLAGTVAAWFVVAAYDGATQIRPALLAAALVPVAWASTRFGAGVGALATAVLGLGAAFGFGAQTGAFAVANPAERLGTAWGFIGYLCATSLALTTLTAHRARAHRIAMRSADRYQRLFDACPYPIWAEDGATGRILLANPAALALYGYAAAEFGNLVGRDLVASAGVWVAGGTIAGAQREWHRSLDGTEFEVDVARVTLPLEGGLLHLCFVEPIAECSALRQAIVTASDRERAQIGRVIADELLPRLSDLAARARERAEAPGGTALHPWAERLNEDIREAMAICSRLTRGASALHWAGGDLGEAFRRLPAALSRGDVTMDVAVAPGAENLLAIDQRDHLYRLVEEALRTRAARAAGGTISTEVFLGADGYDLRLRDDGAATGSPWRDPVAAQALAARAAAAGGRLSITTDATGATELRVRGAATGSPPAAALPGAVPDRAPRIPRAPDPVRRPAGLLLLAAAYFLSGLVGIAFVRVSNPGYLWSDTGFEGPWLPSGFAVVGLMLGGRRLWPAIFVASAALWHWVGYAPWFPAISDAVAEVLATLVVLYALDRFGFDRACERPRDLALVFAAAAVSQLPQLAIDIGSALVSFALGPTALPDALAPTFGAVLGTPGELAGAAAYSEWGAAAGWWIAGCAGVVLVVPACVSWTRAEARELVRRPREFAGWVLALALALAAILVLPPAWRLAVAALTLGVVAVAVVRFCAALAWVATLVVALAATTGYGLGIGVLSRATAGEGPAGLWGFIVLVAVCAQMLVAMLAEGRRLERDARALDRRYRGLYAAVPYAVFVYEESSGRIRMANPAACSAYGRNLHEFAAMRLAELQVEPGETLPVSATDAHRVVATRHRLRHGRIADVELTFVPFGVAPGGRGPGGLCFVADVTERNLLRQRLIGAADQERRKLARDFHDGVGQVLTGLQFGVRPLLVADATPDRAILDFIADAAQEARRTCEEVLHGASPLAATDGDLLRAIRRLPTLMPPGEVPRIRVWVSEDAPVTLPLTAREQVYRVAQEALNNALRHSQAANIEIIVRVAPDAVELSVEDDGIGVLAGSRARPGGIGLESMRLRATALGGRLDVSASTPRGTHVHFMCPQAAEPGQSLAAIA